MKQVVLIGDSIRMGYQETVRRRLAEKADIWAPAENGGTSANVLAHFEAWIAARDADVLHINAGLHDLKREFDHDRNAVPLPEYTANVRAILTRAVEETNAVVLWALTTPVNQDRHHRNKPFDRFEADVRAYNEASAAEARELGVPVNDLYSVIETAGPDALLQGDGVHFTPEGCELLGNRVADCIVPILERTGA